MQHSEENLIWSALDTPTVYPKDWDLFWSAWEKHSGASHIIKSDPAGNLCSDTSKDVDFFKGLDIYAKEDKLLTENHWKVPYLDYKEIFPNLLDDLNTAFPWADILFCRLWMSNMPIPWHRDYTSEPGTLRAMIYDENPKPTFKIFNAKAGVHYINLPKETNTFMYNNQTCFHGSDRQEGINKIVLIIIHKTKDKDQLNNLLEASAARFPDRCKYL